MSNSVIAPTGRGQALMIRDRLQMLSADQSLIFAGTDDLYSLKQRVLCYPPGPQYRFFTAYRLTETFNTVGICGPGTNEAVAAYKKMRSDLDRKVDAVADSVVKDGDVGALSTIFDKTNTEYEALGEVPAVPLTKASRILPPGSLLLRDGEGEWFSLTPEESKAEKLFRTDNTQPYRPYIDPQGSRIVPTSLDLATQKRRLRHWPESASRDAHKKDIAMLREIEQPVVWRRLLGL